MRVKFFTEINTPRVKNFVYFDLLNKIVKCLITDRALGDNFQSFQTALIEAFNDFDNVLKNSRKSLLTPEITLLDEQQIQLWRIIKASARDQQKLSNQEIATAAEFIMSVTKNHGDIARLKVMERSGALTNLAQDLTEKYADLVAKLGLTNFAQQLAETNAAYCEMYDQRLHQWSEFIDGEVKAARAACDDTLENLLILVASGILTRGMAPFKHFVDYVNEAIKVARIAMGAGTQKPEGSVTEEEEVEEEEEEVTDSTNPPTTDPTNPPTTDPSNPPTTDPTNPPTTDPTNPPTGPNTDAWGDGDEGDGSDV